MTFPAAIPTDDYIQRLHTEIERRLSYLAHAERTGRHGLSADARSMLDRTLARLQHAIAEQDR
jgi:hypothetical protein